MAEQNFRSHARFDPLFHFFVAPVLLANVFVALAAFIRRWPDHWGSYAWLLVVSVALLMTAGVARASALRAQDRIIRVEEMLRYQRLLGPEGMQAAQQLGLRQIIALRFASDAELPALARRAAVERMAPKAIKAAVQVWRADEYRV